jgi:BlaI family penicillinase repressor
MTGKTQKAQLSALQIAVMRVLWSRGEAATSEVVAALDAQRGLAHTTVATLLTRLERRGAVAARRDGRTLVYRALLSEDEVRSSMVADLVASLFKGDAAALVAHLVRDEEVGAADPAKIRARLAKASPGAGKARP